MQHTKEVIRYKANGFSEIDILLRVG